MSTVQQSGSASSQALFDSPVKGAKLSGRMSFFELFSTVIAFSAPVSVVAGFIPFVIVFDGLGASTSFLVAMVAMLLFIVGFVTMSRFVAKSGAFYTFITAGLGKTVGLGAAILAIFAYVMFGACTFPFLGLNANALVTSYGGPQISWAWYGLGGWALCAVLGYFRIDLSAKVLTIAMALEVAIVMVFNIAVVKTGGAEGFSAAPFAWSAFSRGSVGLAVLFSVTCYLGFEATVVFRDEVVDPDKTIPRASYLSVLAIGIFYAATAYLLITALGVSHAVEAANKDPANMFADAMQTYVGKIGVDVTHLLVVSSIFASALSCHNIIARYLFTLGSDGVLSRFLGKKHPRHGSPYLASLTTSAMWLTLILGFGYSQIDAALLYGRIAGVGGFCVIMLLFFTSIAVVCFFARMKDKPGTTVWHTLLAPVLSTLGLGALLYMAIANFDAMIGGTMSDGAMLQVLIWGVFVFGMLLARYYKRQRPAAYMSIGHQQN